MQKAYEYPLICETDKNDIYTDIVYISILLIMHVCMYVNILYANCVFILACLHNVCMYSFFMAPFHFKRTSHKDVLHA